MHAHASIGMVLALRSRSGTTNRLQRRVLLAEDDRELRATLSEYLRGEGFAVIAAENGAAAMTAARAKPPDVLVLDLNMPQMDGSEVLESWRASAELKDVPVLLVSAQPELAQVADHYQVRASLAKPFDMDVLCAAIEQLLAHPEPPPDG